MWHFSVSEYYLTLMCATDRRRSSIISTITITMPPKKSNRKSYKKFPEGPTVHKSPLDKGKAPLDLATLGAFSEVLRTLATEPRLAAHKTRLIKAAEAYESMMDETAANAEEERSWAYYKEIKADLRQRVGQLKRRQAIG